MQGKVLGRSGGQTNRVELACRDGRHKSRRRTAATAGLTTTRGGHHKNGYSHVYDDVASVLFVGGNLKSDERALTKVAVRCLATRRRASASKVPRTTGGARSATRTTTVRRTPTTSAATRTGASSPRTSRYRPLRGPIPSPPPLLLLPPRLTYGD